MKSEQKQHATRTDVGIIAVIPRADKFLVIQRSIYVRAPGQYCFPGGGQEPEEDDRQTIIRELREELSLEVNPVRLIWKSISPWQVPLRWWLTEIGSVTEIVPDPQEVQWWGWMTLRQLESVNPLLESNKHFVAALNAGQIEL